MDPKINIKLQKRGFFSSFSFWFTRRCDLLSLVEVESWIRSSRCGHIKTAGLVIDRRYFGQTGTQCSTIFIYRELMCEITSCAV